MRRLPHLQQTDCIHAMPQESYVSPSFFPSLPDVGRKPLQQPFISNNFCFTANTPRDCVPACTDLSEVSLQSCKHCLLYHSALAQKTAITKEILLHVLQNCFEHRLIGTVLSVCLSKQKELTSFHQLLNMTYWCCENFNPGIQFTAKLSHLSGRNTKGFSFPNPFLISILN